MNRYSFYKQSHSNEANQRVENKSTHKFNPKQYENFPPMETPPTERDFVQFFSWIMFNKNEATRFAENDIEQLKYIMDEHAKLVKKKQQSSQENQNDSSYCNII